MLKIDTKIEIYRRALFQIENKTESLICCALENAYSQVTGGDMLTDFCANYEHGPRHAMRLLFPEFWNYRPSATVLWDHWWWNPSDRNIRIDILQKIITALENERSI